MSARLDIVSVFANNPRDQHEQHSEHLKVYSFNDQFNILTVPSELFEMQPNQCSFYICGLI